MDPHEQRRTPPLSLGSALGLHPQKPESAPKRKSPSYQKTELLPRRERFAVKSSLGSHIGTTSPNFSSKMQHWMVGVGAHFSGTMWCSRAGASQRISHWLPKLVDWVYRTAGQFRGTKLRKCLIGAYLLALAHWIADRGHFERQGPPAANAGGVGSSNR
jgi:hypothetical protein